MFNKVDSIHVSVSTTLCPSQNTYFYYMLMKHLQKIFSFLRSQRKPQCITKSKSGLGQ